MLGGAKNLTRYVVLDDPLAALRDSFGLIERIVLLSCCKKQIDLFISVLVRSFLNHYCRNKFFFFLGTLISRLLNSHILTKLLVLHWTIARCFLLNHDLILLKSVLGYKANTIARSGEAGRCNLDCLELKLGARVTQAIAFIR